MVAYNRMRVLIILLLTLFVNMNRINSQELGNPISSLKGNEVSCSLYGVITWDKLADADYGSTRGLSKIEIGLHERFKVFGLFGAGKMFINNSNKSNLTDYRGKLEIAYGGGAQFEIYKIKRTSFFSGAGAFKTKSRGSVISSIQELGTEEEIEMRFDWREFWFAFGAAHKLKRFVIYGGIEEKTLKRMEKIHENEYISGFKTNLFCGVDIFLPANFMISFKVNTLAQNVLYFGISQSSIGN